MTDEEYFDIRVKSGKDASSGIESGSGQDPAADKEEMDILAAATVAGREYVLAANPDTADDDDREVFVLVKVDEDDENDDSPWSLYRDATEEEAEAVGDMLIGIAEENMAEEDEA